MEEEGEEGREESEANWREELTRNLDYYLGTEEGRQKLAERVAKESKALIQEAIKSPAGRREVIWLSKYCLNCAYFEQGFRSTMRCKKLSARLVKPFYGRAIWSLQLDERGKADLVVSDVDWAAKAHDVEEKVVDMAVQWVNGGLPYPCFEFRGAKKVVRPQLRR